MITFSKEMFSGDSHFQELYAKGLLRCPSGIEGLNSSGINPYHQATPLANRTDKRKVVYAIYDNSISSDNPMPVLCFFEDDYVKGFAEYRKFKKATLWVAYLPVHHDCPKKVWNTNSYYIEEHHGNSLWWCDIRKSWFI